MIKVFISGSIGIKTLPLAAMEKINSIMSHNYEILIGDANGVDSTVQKLLASNSYPNVTVYYAGNKIRNNILPWQSKGIQPHNNEKGRELYTLKDIAMAYDADFGLMIWDGKSKGTLNNMLTMKQLNKKFFVVNNGDLFSSADFDSLTGLLC